jgi:hypothetical protein
MEQTRASRYDPSEFLSHWWLTRAAHPERSVREHLRHAG